ncbi:hypothetical protein VNO78_31195 [Psophocarpus tetragonolobus]|uniref:Uncharacterized protein n=1 Tax=Psophocarpus tetragonolobus TaxID=3891 RepID=A0AAN9RXZ8_PSOTE
MASEKWFIMVKRESTVNHTISGQFEKSPVMCHGSNAVYGSVMKLFGLAETKELGYATIDTKWHKIGGKRLDVGLKELQMINKDGEIVWKGGVMFRSSNPAI